MTGGPCKVCPGCGTAFSLSDLEVSPEIEPLGMLLDVEDPATSSYYFNHVCARCGTTFTVPVTAFRDTIEEPIPEEVKAGTAECESHCSRLDDVDPCAQACAHAPYRRLLLRLRRARGGSG